MKKQNIIIRITIILALIIDIIILYNFQHRPKEQIDENALYTERFGNTILKFEKYDYALGQNMIVGGEKSIDGGKTFANAKFNYENDRVDILHIDSFPYHDKEKLNLDCTVYDIALDGNGYVDYLITFISEDNGLTWNLK